MRLFAFAALFSATFAALAAVTAVGIVAADLGLPTSLLLTIIAGFIGCIAIHITLNILAR